MKNFTGSICALATPFRGSTLDLDAFARLLDHQIQGGTQGVVVAGSTGEAHALDSDEFTRLLSFAVRHIDGRMTVFAGTGSANTKKTIVVTKHAQSLGADAALVVTPYYVRPPQDGLLRHFSDVADAGGLPIVLYNVPARTGCDLLPETVAQLATHQNIVGIKEAHNDAPRMLALLALKTPQFAVLSGDDPTALAAMRVGAQGMISVAANLVPHQIRTLCDAALAGSHVAATHVDRDLAPLFEALSVASNPIPLKWGLECLGICSADVRLPLVPLQAQYHGHLRQVLDALAVPPTVQARHSSAA